MYRQLDRCGGEWERERERERASALLTQLLVTTAPQVALTELLSFAPAMECAKAHAQIPSIYTDDSNDGLAIW